jgi:hypothetical protein
MDFDIKPFSKKALLKDINLFFSDTVEVVKLIETCTKDVVQLVAIDHETDIYSILTWDFVQNVEVNLM